MRSARSLPFVLPRLALIVAALAGTGCDTRMGAGSYADVNDTPAGPDVVARFGQIDLTVDDLDRYVLSLPAKDRPAPGANLDAWYRLRARELVVDRVFLAEAKRLGRDQAPEFLQSREFARQQIQVELCLHNRLAEMPPFSKADLEAEFERHRDSFQKPERRLTFNLFRRASNPEAQSRAVQELTQLRDRILNGDNFSRLAREHSDSETRHKGGEIGWLERGTLPPAMDEIVFGLEEGVPSQPITTTDGVHVFFVQSLTPAREATLSEAMPVLRDRLQARRVEQLVKPIAEQDSRRIELPSREAFEALLKNSGGDQVLMSGDDFSLTVAAFRRKLSQVKQDRSVPVTEAWRYLQVLRTREQFRAVCASNDWIDQNRLTDSLQVWEEQVLIDRQRAASLLELAKQNEPRLLQYYNQNIEQFGPPLRWQLRRLRMSVNSQGFGELEQLVRPGTTLESLQARFGGEIAELPNQQQSDLRRISPVLPGVIAPLKVGQVSAPLRTQAGVEVFQLVEESEGSAPSFQEVKERVASTFVAHHAADLYQAFAEQLLEDRPIEFFAEPLARLVNAGLPDPDISAETLEQLLEAL
ncbi:peptidylprolyl isomerase [Pseudomarimonas arenosa]|uniref:peptidylprolyl isomerase n=1 Tax=Pseudomarimonas arenosa TaxID=2774145 RepID=A0AAW3ZPC8_9GAMM|nr:peptidyl-prolyl cis-trans isomerase [Pseudomarimonas arenosa]MBD8526477.1 peptidylprolyl isomerase [Pseudomarimonas arenosa]